MRKQTEDITKLPKWAQNHISRLEDRIREREKDLAEFRGESPTNVFVRCSRGYSDLDLVPLPKDSTVVFILSEGRLYERTEFHVSLSRDRSQGPAIDVRGLRGIVVKPVAGNVIEVSNEDRT